MWEASEKTLRFDSATHLDKNATPQVVKNRCVPPRISRMLGLSLNSRVPLVLKGASSYVRRILT